MATTLKSLIQFVNVPAGGSVTLPHNIKSPAGGQVGGERAIRPDIAFVIGSPGTTFTFLNVGDDQILAFNHGIVAATVQLLCEYWHTLERGFGAVATTQLQAPTIFVYSAGNAGSPASAEVRVATTIVGGLPAYVAAGAGPGKTLTAVANGQLTLDSIAVATGDRVLVKNLTAGGTSGVDCGLFEVTQPGSAGTPWILTRAPDADAADELVAGRVVTVTEGQSQADTMWELATNEPIVVDTTPLTFVEVAPYAYSTAVVYVLEGTNKATEIQNLASRLNLLFLADGLPRTIVGLGRLTFDKTCDLSNLFSGTVEKKWLTIDLSRAVCLAGFTGTADDTGNAFFKVWGTVTSANVNTTVATRAVRGQNYIDVAAVGTAAANQWIAVEGSDQTAEQTFGMSDGVDVILREIRKITAVAGQRVDVSHRWSQDHVSGAGVTVKTVTPGGGIEFISPTFDGTGQTVAVGISMKYATSVTIVGGARGTQMTRTVVYAQACYDVHADDSAAVSGCNGIVHFDTTCEFTADRVKVIGTGGGAASGVKRFCLWTRCRCSDGTFRDYDVHDVSGGAEQWGGVNLVFSGRAFGCNPDAMVAARAALATPEMVLAGTNGITWAGGAGPLNFAEFSVGTRVEYVKGTSNYTGVARVDLSFDIYNHDTTGADWGEVEIVNLSGFVVAADADTTGFYVGGMLHSDAGGYIGSLVVKATRMGFQTENAGFNGVVEKYSYDGSGANISFYGFPFRLGHTGSFFRIQTVDIGNSGGLFRTQGAFGASALDSLSTFDNFNVFPYYGDHVEIVFNATGVAFSAGEACEIDTPNSSALRLAIKQPAGTTFYPVVVMTGATFDTGGGWMLAAVGAQRRVTILVDMAAAAGVFLDWTAARRGTPNAVSVAYSAKTVRNIAGAGLTYATMCDR